MHRSRAYPSQALAILEPALVHLSKLIDLDIEDSLVSKRSATLQAY